VNLLHSVRNNRAPIYTAGRLARKTFEENYERKIGTAQIASIIGMSAGKVIPKRAASTVQTRPIFVAEPSVQAVAARSQFQTGGKA
jgi:hypothetical protein